jgi:hypothetical protein
MADKHSSFPWFRSLRKVELLDIWTKCDVDLSSTIAFLAAIKHLEQLTSYLQVPIDNVIQRLPPGYVDKVVCPLPEFPDECKAVFFHLTRIKVRAIELIGQRGDHALTDASMPEVLTELRIRNINLPAERMLVSLPKGL